MSCRPSNSELSSLRQSNAFSSSGKRTVVNLEIKSLTPLTRSMTQQNGLRVYKLLSVKTTSSAYAMNPDRPSFSSKTFKGLKDHVETLCK